MNQINRILLVTSLFIFSNVFSQINTPGGETCEEVQPFCSDDTGTYIFSNVTDVGGIGQIGCMNSSENPAWFFIRVEQTGRLEFEIEQNESQNFIPGLGVDVDFIAWGPFNTPDSNCSNLDEDCVTGGCPDNTSDPNYYLNNLDGGNIVDCSWSALSIESFTIPNAVAGEFYILLISNFDNDEGFIRLTQTNFNSTGAGSTDCSIITGDLGPDQEVCEGVDVILDGTPSVGTADSFQWFIDEGTGMNPIAGATDALYTINDNRSGLYRVEVSDIDGNTGFDEVLVTFFPQPTITPLADPIIEQCDDDGNNNGLHIFDLTLYSEEFMGPSQTAAGTFEVIYYNTETDAQINENPIGDPANYQNSSGPFITDQIWARVVNSDSPNTCTAAIASFELLVQSIPDIQNTSNYELCDDNLDGNDLDGFVQNFDLSIKDADILGITQDPTNFTVSYYLNATDASTGSNPLDSANLIENPVAFNTPLFVRVENNTTGCFSFTDNALFSLIVNPLPVITNPVLLEACDDDQNGSFAFDLTEANVLISANSTNETFRFYPTETDALDNTNEILNPTNYTNVNITNDAVWVRTITINGCFRVSRVDLEVSNTVVPDTFQRTYDLCDDFLDTNGNNNANNDDTDGISTFDFSSVVTDITSLFPPTQTINLSFYESLDDANNDVNPIPDISNHRNVNSPNSQDIYIRVENPANNICLYTGTHITLIVDPVPTASPALDMDICCLLYTSPSPRDKRQSRMPSSA